MRHRDPDREDIMMTRAALALCENIDWNVGRVLEKLDELDLRQETIVIYFSDNGPNSYRWNGGMKGRKGSLDEGGLHSPFFIRWPDQIPAGTSIAHIAGAIDLLPTLVDLADIDFQPPKPLDGRSLRPLLLESGSNWEPRSLFSVKQNQVSCPHAAVPAGCVRPAVRHRRRSGTTDRRGRSTSPTGGETPSASGPARRRDASLLRQVR